MHNIRSLKVKQPSTVLLFIFISIKKKTSMKNPAFLHSFEHRSHQIQLAVTFLVLYCSGFKHFRSKQAHFVCETTWTRSWFCRQNETVTSPCCEKTFYSIFMITISIERETILIQITHIYFDKVSM